VTRLTRRRHVSILQWTGDKGVVKESRDIPKRDIAHV